MKVPNKLKKMWPSSLRSQLILGIAFILTILMSLLVWQLMNRQKNFFLKLNHDRAFGLSTTLASTASSYVVSYELAGLQKLVSSFKNNPGVEYVMVISNDDIVLAHTDKKYLGFKTTDSVSSKLRSINGSQMFLENDSTLDIVTPITNHDEIVGWTRIGLSQEYIKPNLKEIRRSGLLFILISLIVGSIFAIIVAEALSRSLQRLVIAAKKIKEGDRDIRVSSSRSAEISALGTAFNQMLDEVSSHEKLLSLVLENLPVGVFILDEKGNILSANPAGKEMWKGIKYVGTGDYNIYKAWFTETGKEVQPHEWGAAIVLAEGKSVLDQEIKIECFDKTHKIILNSAIPLRDENEKIIGVITINVDITERKNAEVKIKERESLLTAVFETIEGSIALYDVNKKIVLFNNRFAHNYKLLTNQEPKTGDGGFDFLSEDVKKEPSRLMDSTLNGNKEVFENDYLSNGKLVSFRTSFNPVINDGKITGITSFSLDITKTKEAEIKIRETEERFRSIIAVSNTGGWEYHRDSDFLWCSPEYFKMLGRKESDYDLSGAANLKETWIDLLHPEDKERAVNHFAEYLKNGSVGTYENYFRLLHSNGEWVWILSRGQTLLDKHDQVTNLTVGTHIDITEHKKAEINIREKEEKFRVSFMTSQDAFYIGTLEEGRIIDVNDSFYNLFGYTREEAIGKTSTELNLYVYAEQRAKMVTELKAKGHVKDLELTSKKRNGELIVISVTVNSWRMNNEEVIMAVIRDITQKKRIEKELIESEVRFREVLENSISASYKRNLKTNIYDYLSPVFKKIAGYTQDEINTMPIEVVIGMMHPDDIETVTEGINKAITDPGKVENSIEYRFKHKITGEYRWLKDEFAVMYDSQQQADSFIGSVSDITEQKESELKFKNLVEKSLVGVYIIQKGKYVYVNPRFWEILGYTQEEMLNTDDVQNIVYEDYQPDELIEWRKKVAAGIIDDFHLELQYRRKNGEIIWAEVSGGETLYQGTKAIVGTFQDITKRKNAEALIKEQAETFEAIIENTNESIWLLSPDLKVLQYNKTAKDRLLLQRGKEIYIGANFEEFLNVGTEEAFTSMFNTALAGKYTERESMQANVRGEIFWLRTKMYPVYNTVEKLLGVVVLFENITDRKKSENELKESEEKFRSLVEETSVGVFIIQDEKMVYVNPGFETISGYPEKELLNGMTFQQLIYEEDVSWVEENHELRITGEKPSDEYILRAVRKDGKMIFVDVIVSRIIYNNKPAVIGSVIDKTRQVEEEKRIGRAVTDAQEKERTQIGMELHDNVKQLMAASIMSLDFAKSKIDEKERSIEIIDNVKGYILEAVNELRRLSHQLAPAVDTNTGTLVEKIEKLVNDTKISDKMEVLVDVAEFDKPIDTEIQLAFYRIMQEQLTNILKYSKASTVLIKIREKDQRLNMVIIDDGIGFDTTLKKDGIGLENIKRRINILNGNAEIISSPGEGCEVKVSVPFD